MSELYYYLHQRPKAIEGNIPVCVRGNWFWKNDQRFLIKGVSYIPRISNGQEQCWNSGVDPLSDEWLSQLRQDIPYLHQLGINTIYISKFDVIKQHDRALSLLRDEGIHVLFELFTNFKPVDCSPHMRVYADYSTLDPLELYTAELLRENLKVIDQTADYPNVLAYNMSARNIIFEAATKLSTVVRAAIRDAKEFIALRSGRRVPVGVSTPDIMTIRKPSLDFYTAGPETERADFYSHDCFSWAGKSDFKMSGYKHHVEMAQHVPVPMFFSAYGTAITHRGFSEVECLYSPDMTSVFSGGIVYTYLHGAENYNLVRVDAQGFRIRTQDFWAYRKRLSVVARRSNEEVNGQHAAKDNEDWRREFPATGSWWNADPEKIPPCPLDLKLDARGKLVTPRD